MVEKGADWGPSYAEFAASCAAHSREQFRARLTTPVLLVWTANEPEAGDPSQMFTTIRLKAKPGPRTSPRAILDIKKRAGSNAFADMITIGRAANNDIVLPDGAISKFHCYVRRVGNEWRLTDAKSTNGTVVRGAMLAPGGSAALTS